MSSQLYIITRLIIIFRKDVRDTFFHLKLYNLCDPEIHNFHLEIHRCIDGENASHGVTSFQLFALHFRGRCEVWKMRGRKNAKSTKCIAQHIPTQLRSFPTKIFPVNLRRKHALAFCTRFEYDPL